MKFASGSSRHVPEPWKEHRCVRWLREEIYRAFLSGRTSAKSPEVCGWYSGPATQTIITITPTFKD